uniref:Uncharacterized protein n=1 Tax=uncultured marine thaumarchaeote KM3_04_H06 TaxID=1455967 RepID=A0A075G442_9ARCH|nr:hypothetical protein [uncultured marine thaumarchaeote KM3_04_H06]
MVNYLPFQFQSDHMAKFDSIRMADLTEVQDPDKDGGITLVFKDNKFLHIKIEDGKLVTESIPE